MARKSILLTVILSGLGLLLPFGQAGIVTAAINDWDIMGLGGHYITELAVSCDTGFYCTFIAADEEGAFLSGDGYSWEGYSDGLPTYPSAIRDLASEPSTLETHFVYAGTDAGVFKNDASYTGSWWPLATGLGTPPVYTLAIDPATPSIVYAGGDAGVYKSTDGGGTWAEANTGFIPITSVYSLAIDPMTPSTLYAATEYGVFKSTNSGGDWSLINLIMSYIHTLVIDPATPTTLYGGTSSGGIYKSTNGGVNWGPMNTGLTNLAINALEIDPNSPMVLYAGTEGGGVFQTKNGGGEWSAINTGLTNLFVTALAIHPFFPGKIYAGTDDGVFGTTVPPESFGKTTPADSAYVSTNPSLSWDASLFTDSYEFCFDTSDNDHCDSSWIWNESSTSAALSGLGNNDTYYWQVRAWNPGGTTYADDDTWWSFTARDQTFADVPIDHPFWAEIEAFYSAGITTGCGVDPLRFCPDNTVTRAAMAVFLLRAKYGSTYTPPAATHTFSDLPVVGKEWQEAWVDQFYLEGITSGCGISPLIYCPENPVTRAAMAVFILRALYGSGYTPPAATHTFSDMPVLGKEWMEPWVDEFYRLGITGGCGTDPLRYCPENSIKRQGMAAFIVRAFGLPLP